MEILIKIGYILGSLFLGIYVYFWSSTFKKLGLSTREELNEGEEIPEEMVDELETKWINYFGTTVFILIGIIIWTLIGITIGRITSQITDQPILKWIAYFLMYFIFLRIPFGVGNKMVIKSYDLEFLPEKIIFAIFMVVAYVWSICCYDSLPSFLKWHLCFLL